MTMENDLVERKAWPLGGYAPGHYSCTCIICGKLHEADKRASQCLVCAAQGANARIQALEAELARKTEALEFYRDGFTFTANPRYGGLEWKPTEVLLDDCGNVARMALAARSVLEEKTDV